MSNSAPNGTMNMDLVKSCVLNEEVRKKSQGSSSRSDVLVTEKRGGVRVEVQRTETEAKARLTSLPMLSVIIAI